MPLCRSFPRRAAAGPRLRLGVALATSVLAAVAGALVGTTPAAADPSAADLTSQLAAATRQLDVVVEAYDQATLRLAGLQQQATALAATLGPMQALVAGYDTELSALVSTLYEQGAGTGLAALLGAGSPGATLDGLATMDYFAAERDQLLSRLRSATRDLDNQQGALDLLTAQARNQQAGLAAQRTAIEARIATLQQLRRKLYGTASASPPRVDPFVPAYQAGPAGVAVRYAFAQIGKAYQYGADGPNSYDCSGLVLASWRQAGVSLPHSAAAQWGVVSHLARSQLQPGDLVFYYSDIHHVAIYIGGGRVVHAPTWGQSVTTAPIDLAPIHGYGRVHY